jgi:membrane-anchored protein YejM (alkaline phosphatase superfamily)
MVYIYVYKRLRALGPQSQVNRTFLDNFYRARIQTLQSVDELIGDIFRQLIDNGVDDNTIVIFTSDNGYHLGNHNMIAGKETCFEEDIKTFNIILQKAFFYFRSGHRQKYGFKP